MSDDGDPPIGAALAAALALLFVFVFFWVMVAMWTSLDPLSR